MSFGAALFIGYLERLLAVLAIVAISYSCFKENAKMFLKFVVVPAVPKNLRATRHGGRYYCKKEPIEFNICDNVEK